MKKYTDKQKLHYYRKKNQELLKTIRLVYLAVAEDIKRDDFRLSRRKPKAS